MNHTGGFVYADQKAAEDRVDQLRGQLVDLVDALTALNESIDSLKLARLIEQKKFLLGI